ncbi:MAG: hypothetical protein JNL02_17440 [Saprospiraceae bacterium]|nr:hypothetical protein [Saprospiraceae bacterium]
MLSHPNLTPACRRVSLLPKRARRILCGLLLCLLGAANLSAQWTNWRATTVDASLPEQVLDTLSLLPPLLGAQDSISGQSLDARFFTLQNNRLLIDTAALQAAHPGCSRLTLRYRVLPYNLAAPFRRLDTLAIRRPGAPEDDIRYDYSPYTPSKNIWETNSLRSNGAYVRGLSFGNNQNLVFNSNLNLQLDGRLGNDLELSAALSDNSIPLQPDGTTRQLQEFDRIYIQLRRKNTALTAGDYDLTRPQGYFSNYFKRLQGGMVNGLERLPGRDTLTYRAAAAVSRGKFARQIIQGQEGNQGPYRLQGAEGERFIIVLAGTEKVYIDGQLLRRGLDDDYIIDYNLGEVSFTPRRLITKDSRIIVEFEYAVQAYLRATMAGNVEWRQTRGRTYLNVYSEQDSRNSGGAQDLSPEERGRLAQVGDDLSEAFASGVDTLSDYDPARVQYKALDTLICGVLQTILVYSVNTDSARYTARFTEVSQGQGRYVQAFTAANGRVFRWAGFDPITCQPLGNFEPVVKLIAPEGRQLFALGSEYRLGARTQLNAETALSRLDLNRFSPLDSRDDADVAVFAGIRHLLVPDKKGWQMQLRGNYERTGTHFTPLNPYRPAEFIRDWNLGANEAKTAEQLARAELLTQKKGWGSARYEFGSFTRRGLYEGQRHFAQTRLSRGGFEFFGEINALHTASSLDDTRFSRPKFDFSKTLFTQKDSLSRVPFIKIGVYGERERNERRSTGKDTLTQASFWYDLGRLYVQMPEGSGPLQLGASLTHRSDFAPMGALFRQNTAADEINFNGRWQPAGALPVRSISQSVSWNLSWRQLRIIEPELTNQEAQNTYLGRVDYTLSAWKNALNLTTGYEISSGQSPRLEFSYVKVNPGEGQYTWVDRNRDSILQVDEMEIAVFQDQATYVRVAVSTTDYIRTDNVVFNQNLRFEPRVLWAGAKRGWRRVGRRLSTQSTLQINRRVYSGITGISPWNPFDLSIADTALVTVSSTVRNVLFFNRADPAWDASLAQGDSRSRVALTTGFESRRVADWTLHGRLNLGRRWSVEADVALNQKASDNEVFASRDYRLSGWQAGPKVNWLPQRSLRLSLVFSGQNLANSLPSGENATQTDWNLELTWNPAGKSNAAGFRPATALRARATYADVRYTGQPNTPVAYAMLEGLQNGRNYLWGLTLDRQLSKSLQLNLSYEGRKTGEFGRLVHVGRAQVRAVF